MPYLNDYNKKIADEIYQQDKALIDHLDREALQPMKFLGGGTSGGKMYIQDKYIEDVIRGGCMNCGCQPDMSRQVGGTGYGKATWKDDGYGQELGLGTVESFKPVASSKGGVKEMKKEDSKICYVGVGSGTKELKDDLSKFDFNRVKDWIGLGKHLKMSGKGWEEFKKDLGSFDFNKVKSWIGLGKYGKKNTKIMMGAGFWDDFKRGFNMVFEPASKYLLKPLAGLTGNVPVVAGLTALGYAKPKRGRKSKMGMGMKIDKIPIIMPVIRDKRLPPKDIVVKTDDLFGSGTKELKDDISKFDFNRIKNWFGMAKPKDFMALKKHIKMSGKGWEEFKKDLGSFDFNKVKSWIGLGKYGKANSKRMMGSGWWDSFTSFFTRTIPNIANTVVNSVKDTANRVVGDIKNVVGLGKSGGRAKRAEIVKKVMKDKNLSMIKASQYVKQHNLY